jgi:DNA-3-methyladenine glycosylase
MYDMLNIVASTPGDPQAVLIRAAQPLNFTADLTGPGKLCRALHITTKRDNALDLTNSPLFFLDDGAPPPPIQTTPRINIDYAQHWTHAPLRFVALNPEP